MRAHVEIDKSGCRLACGGRVPRRRQQPRVNGLFGGDKVVYVLRLPRIEWKLLEAVRSRLKPGAPVFVRSPKAGIAKYQELARVAFHGRQLFRKQPAILRDFDRLIDGLLAFVGEAPKRRRGVNDTDDERKGDETEPD